MSETHKPAPQQPKAAAAPPPEPKPIPNPNIAPEPEPVPPTPEQKAHKAKHDEAIDKVSKANTRLDKEGRGVRLEANMRHGEPVYRWGNFVPTRELTKDELKAIMGIGV